MPSPRAGRVGFGPNRTGSASVIQPTGPEPGDWNVAVEVVSVFVTLRAAWSSPFAHTSAPQPRAAGLSATRKAARRLRGPSVPLSSAWRIEQVNTIGAATVSSPASRSVSHAVCSIVSVPWVTTTPLPPTTASRARSATVAIVAASRFQLLVWATSTTSTSPSRSISGWRSSSSRPVSWLTTDPPGPGRLAIVPPVAISTVATISPSGPTSRCRSGPR